MITVERQQSGSALVLRVYGHLLLGRPCEQLEKQVDEALKDNLTTVIFDLTHTTAMDSSGLGIIVACARKTAAAGGQLGIAGANGAVESLCRRTGVNKRIAFYSTVDEALAAVNPAS